MDYFSEVIITESNNPSPGSFLIATKKYSDSNGSNYVAIVDDYRVFSAQHSVSRTKNGNLLFFDNGNGSENEFSRVV